MRMRILAIETSCDETALAIVQAQGPVGSPKFQVERSIIASQVKLHARYGGVVPNLAKREHIRNLPILLGKIGSANSLNPKQYNACDIDLIAVTVGPGLEPALWVGVEYAKQLAKKWKKPLVGVNHIEGHLYSFLLSEKDVGSKQLHTKPYTLNPDKIFPAIALVVSGGHTILVLMKSLKEYKKLGETLDDAVGESFDKVARLLNLPYPGGPEIEKFARKGNPQAIAFPSPVLNQKNYNFSYSGLKTAVLYYLKNLGSIASDFSLSRREKESLRKIESRKNLKADIAASFQRAAFLPLVVKAIRAAKEFKAKSIVIGGGVAANKELHRFLKSKVKSEKLKISVVIPPIKYCMDNAVMIGVASYINKLRNRKYPLEANGNLNL